MREPLKRYDSLNANMALDNVRNIIAISSGKGGVGKSTVAFHLAWALHSLGLRVGLVDADIHGPSMRKMTAIDEKATVRHDKKFEPHLFKGMPLLSIAHLVEPSQALAFRGPMASGALMQLVTQTAWPELDILLLDMPPGTGDIHLTACQKLPLTGSLLVTTNHGLSLEDYARGRALYQKLQLKILGTVVNQLQPFETPESMLDFDAMITIPCSADIFNATGAGKILEKDHQGYEQFRQLAEKLLDSLTLLEVPEKIPFSVKS